jgi:Tfp pilus assembly protein FimT
MLELTVVLVLGGIMTAFAMLSFSGYFQRTSAQGAAQLFARDLSLARSTAVRTREAVVIRFYETTRWYEVEVPATETEVVQRRFGINADIDLSAIDLDFVGDSVVFSSRGVADLSQTGPPATELGVATFSVGEISYSVSFNSMGASKVERN